ncbi:MAG: transposase, partial [Cyanobium sp.]
MARSGIQFQKGLSLPEFQRLDGTEEQCEATMEKACWPEGFRCPRCRSQSHLKQLIIVFMKLTFAIPFVSHPAQAEVQQRCDGTLLEARGNAEQERPIARLRVSLSLEAEARSSERALDLLQERLAAVRRTRQGLGVQELRVTSPSTWQRPAEGGTPSLTQASLQV